MKKKVNQLKMGAILSYVSLFLTNIISIVYTPIMLRLLGQAEFGLYNIANSIIGYLGVLDFGLGNAIIRYTAKYRANEDKDAEYNLNGIFVIVYSLIALFVIVVGGVFVINIENIFSRSLSVAEIGKMKILMSIMIFNLAISFPGGIFGGIITAYERFIFPKVIGIIRAILNPFIMIPVLIMGYGSIGLIAATTVINIVYILINMYYCFKVLNIKMKFNSLDFSVLKEISGYSFFIFLNLIVDKIYWSTDQFILGAIKGSAAVAIYAVGSTFNTYYMSFSTAISSVFLPRITTMVTKNATDKEISDIFIKTGRIQYIIMAFILGGFISIGKGFIDWWAGPGYSEAYYIALIVMIPFTVPLIQNIGITILQAKNMHKFRSNVYICIAILNVIASIPLAKLYGGIGCAIATSVAMFVGNVIIINIYYYKAIKIDIIRFWKEILFMTIPVLLTLFLSFGINSIITGDGILILVIKGVLYSIIYVILIYFIGMNNYEKNLFLDPLRSIKNKIITRR